MDEVEGIAEGQEGLGQGWWSRRSRSGWEVEGRVGGEGWVGGGSQEVEGKAGT